MRLGIVTMPRPVPGDGPAGPAERLAGFARTVEELGFAGLWTTDSLGRGWHSLDPLVMLATAAAVTRRIEIGTCVLQVPLRQPVELANRVQSLDALAAGRLRLGVGTGSTKADFDAVQADYDGRFKALPGLLETMRRTWAGEGVYGPALSVWPGTEGGPPLLLGAWRSPRWIDLAARVCQGWIASGIHTRWEDLEAGLAMYRQAGGVRALVANVFTDLRSDPVVTPMIAHARIQLVCAPAEARERLRRLAGMGIDDALLVCPFETPEQLPRIRELWP